MEDKDIDRGFDEDEPSFQSVYVATKADLSDEEIEDIARNADAVAYVVVGGVDSVIFSVSSESLKRRVSEKARLLD